MTDPIYKIVASDEWAAAKSAGRLEGTAVDLADGYIHFSTAEQLAETLDKHYRGRTGLVVARVDPELIAAELRWEPSRGGALFPHLYAPLPMAAVSAEFLLDAGPDGSFDLSEVV